MSDEPIEPEDIEEPEDGADVPEEGEVEEVEKTVEEQLADTQAKAAEYLEGWQRARAEFANAKKRMDRDRIESYRNATVDVVGKLLPVIDDFNRALENVPAGISDDNWFEGINLVHRKLNGILERVNIEPIEALGQPFDPNFHEAIMKEPSDEYDSDVVIRELQIGYKLDSRVIRPSLVVVAA